jgi:hypothetical protein
MTDGYEGKEDNLTTISYRLANIEKICDKIETFIDNFDTIFNTKYEAKRKDCPGYLWCMNGTKDFYKLKEDYGLHIKEHDTVDNMNVQVITNKKWIIGVFVAAFLNLIGLIFVALKYFFGKG